MPLQPPPLKAWHAGLVLLAAASLLALQLMPNTPEALRFSRPAFAGGQWWQLLSAQLVHLNLRHATLNAVALAVTLLAWRVWITLPRQGLALAGGALGVALVLTLDRDCSFYAGLSGALHGLWAGNAIFLMCARDQVVDATRGGRDASDMIAAPRFVAALVLLALAGKLAWQDGAAAGAFDAWLQIPVYRPAHWAGLGGGLVAAGLALCLRSRAASARR